MAHDLIRSAKKAALTRLKGYAPLTSLVAKTSIDPQAGTAGVLPSGEVKWPFVRFGPIQAVPQGRRCNARSTLTFAVHSFSKPIYNTQGAITKTAEDAAGEIHAAIVEALHHHRYEYQSRSYKFSVTSSNIMQDGAEADAFHAIANVSCEVWWG